MSNEEITESQLISKFGTVKDEEGNDRERILGFEMFNRDGTFEYWAELTPWNDSYTKHESLVIKSDSIFDRTRKSMKHGLGYEMSIKDLLEEIYINTATIRRAGSGQDTVWSVVPD